MSRFPFWNSNSDLQVTPSEITPTAENKGTKAPEREYHARNNSGTSSLDGTTICSDTPRSRAGSDSSISETEMIYEAVGLPPPVLNSRPERRFKLKGVRARAVPAKRRPEPSVEMVQELKSVIQHRPRGRRNSRVTTL